VRRPELAVRGEPLVELRERLRPEAIQAPLCVCARLHEARVPQHAKVLGDRRLADPEAGNELADRPFAATKNVENLQPVRLGEDLKRGRCHRPSITIGLYACQEMDEQSSGPRSSLCTRRRRRGVVFRTRVLRKDLFVHHGNIAGDGFKSLAEGARVWFEQREGAKGPEATNGAPVA
jgi:cold shock CspA family protein